MTKPFIIGLDPDCAHNPVRLHLAIIEAAMLWPDNPEARTAWERAARVRFLTSFLEHVEDLASLREFGMLAAHSSRIEDLNPEAQERMKHGLVAGWVLHEAIGRAELIGREVRFGEAAADITRYLEKTLRGRFRISKKTFDNSIWPRFRSIAHFWAAYASANMGKDDRSRVFPCTLDQLVPFLSTAEAYRLKGETLRGKHAASPLLRPDETVRLPPDLPLPTYRLNFFSP